MDGKITVFGHQNVDELKIRAAQLGRAPTGTGILHSDFSTIVIEILSRHIGIQIPQFRKHFHDCILDDPQGNQAS